MRRVTSLVGLTTLWLGAATGGATAQTSQELFQTRCTVCHTIGGGKLVGPDLQGVAERRSEDWIIRFVQHSQQLVQSGDPDAVALFEEFNGIPMPDQSLSEREIRGIIDYIVGGSSTAPAEPPPIEQATAEQILLGQALFQGKTRFANSGPTCNSCHDVINDAVIGGGVLARELTTVFSRLGGPGVRAILGSPPFPVMQRAYRDKPLTDDEVVALVGFLQQADAEQPLHQPRDYGMGLLGAGVVGTVLLLGLYSLMWRGRLRGSVNQSIYDRQITSI
ncbi:MAG: cytochrome c [Gemmatimonadetes bacterium]|nr:cytochrome c [Gemmatimonadota bacterium]